MHKDKTDRQVETLTGIALTYQAMLDHHGPVPAGVCWSEPVGQMRRFEYLCADIDPTRPVSVNDVGCGYGALFDFLTARFDLIGYCGTDICEAMLVAAQGSILSPLARFEQSALSVSMADWSLASGTFNLHNGADPVEWRELVQTILVSMARYSRVGMCFNMLDVQTDQPLLWGAEPGEWEEFCQRRLCGRTTLIHHPNRREWTLRVRLNRD